MWEALWHSLGSMTMRISAELQAAACQYQNSLTTYVRQCILSQSMHGDASAMLQYEGSVWRALGIMTAAGGLRNAVLLLRELRMPDAAAAFCAACKEAGFHSAFAPADAGGLLSNAV